MSIVDEPVLKKNLSSANDLDFDNELPKRIKRLCNQEDYGILCSQTDSQPYGSIMAYAVTEDLKKIVFVTQIHTRKFNILNNCNKTAFVIDNRSKNPDDMMKVEAITATGKCKIIADKDFKKYQNLLLVKHPYLKSYTQAKSCRIFSMEVVRYFHVVRLQEVSQWTPINT